MLGDIKNYVHLFHFFLLEYVFKKVMRLNGYKVEIDCKENVCKKGMNSNMVNKDVCKSTSCASKKKYRMLNIGLFYKK